MDAGWWAVVVGGVGAVGAVIMVWLMVRYRRRDRSDQVRSIIEGLVRECEGHRVLWNPFSAEEPRPSYLSVQALRRAVRNARGELPPGTPGVSELDEMKRSAEAFCDRYERLVRRRSTLLVWRKGQVNIDQLTELIATLRAAFVPALERLRIKHGIPAGHRPARENPFIGEELGMIYIPPRDPPNGD